MASNTNPPSRGGLSLYANLLNQPSGASTSSTISSAPVLYKQPGSEDAQKQEEKKKVNSAALLFQPTKRPQIASQKAKSKTAFPKPSPLPVNSSSPDPGAKAAAQAQAAAPAVKTTLADWTADDDDVNGFYMGEKRQRGGRKKRKKNKEEAPVMQDWDDIYDPARPNNYDEYKNSEESIREIRDWKDRLYAHRRARRHSSDDASSDDYNRTRPARFAPPSKYSFAPPPNLDSLGEAPPPPPADISDAATGEDAYAQRIRLSQMAQQQPPPPPPPIEAPPPPLEPVAPPPPPPPPPPLPSQPPATISRAPVRYNLPAPSAEIPASEEELEETLAEVDSPAVDAPKDSPADAPRSNRPGQAGFAQRIMAKYGYVKGKGLGANESGIINALQVQVEKRKKLPDSEGGGFTDRGGKGKIVGGKKAKGTEEKEGKFGPMSDVVVAWGMVDGLNLEEEMSSADGGIRQKIGDACQEKYGRVERVFVHENIAAESIPVFVKFTSQLSALRAVTALDDSDFKFNGNKVRARFYNSENFEQGIYE